MNAWREKYRRSVDEADVFLAQALDAARLADIDVPPELHSAWLTVHATADDLRAAREREEATSAHP